MIAILDQITFSKQPNYDSDQDTNDTTSQTSSNGKNPHCINYQLNSLETIEIDVKPQRKPNLNFPYKQKYKTELCKTYTLTGYCRYGSHCSFAHGPHELNTPPQSFHPQSSKTKPCKKYFINGYCPYGYRCQYLHEDIQNMPQYYGFIMNLYKEKGCCVDRIVEGVFGKQLEFIQRQQELVPVSSRLKIFLKLEEYQGSNQVNNANYQQE